MTSPMTLPGVGNAQVEHPRIVFTHIPKCAGTSLASAITTAVSPKAVTYVNPWAVRDAAQQYLRANDPQAFFREYPQLQRFLLLYCLHLEAPVIIGHLPVHRDILQSFSDHYAFVTLLREPVDRWISHYVHNKLCNVHPLTPPCSSDPRSPSDELQSVLSSWRGWQLGHTLLTFLTGRFPDPACMTDILQDAKHNLTHFRVIGFLHRLTAFESQCHNRLTLSLQLPHLNRTSQCEQHGALYQDLLALFNSTVRARIRDLCSDDLALYDYALSKYA